MKSDNIRVLLVEDDEDDYMIIKRTLTDIYDGKFSLDWISEAQGIKEKIGDSQYDICLMDYRLGRVTGIDLMKDLKKEGLDIPFILLTGYGDRDIDVLAMESGAADYLEKEKIGPGMLEHTIRYAMERKRHMQELQISEQRLRVLSARLVEAQENERKRVAKEIHDGIGSNLVAIKYGLESILTRMAQNKPFGEGLTMEQIIDYMKDTIEETRRISSDLRPSILDDKDLGASVGWICRRYQEIFPEITFNRLIEPEEMDVPQALKVVIFRILQEALNNVVKHSGADNVHLDIKKSDEQLLLKIKDNGRGFDQEDEYCPSSGDGVGLMSMKERVELSGGSIEIISKKGEGSELKAIWGLKKL
jgi:signal transduction histidine kinase